MMHQRNRIYTHLSVFLLLVSCLLCLLVLNTAAEQKGDSQQEAPTVEITSEKQQMIGVKTARVTRMLFQRLIKTTGRIEFDERKSSVVTSRIGGWVEKLYVDYTGKFVKQGDPLLEIYSPELWAAQQEYLNLLKWSSKHSKDEPRSEVEAMFIKDTQLLLEAARKRLSFWHVTEEDIREIEGSGKAKRTFTLFSHQTGYTTKKDVLLGMKINVGDSLFTITDTSRLWVLADIYEQDVSFVRTGMPALVRLSYMPEREFRSKIEFINPLLSGDSRTAKARLTIENAASELIKSQMLTDVEIRISSGSRTAVPEEAVIDTGKRKIVYVDKGSGYFEPRVVSTGMRSEGMIEIVRGLKEGEKVATSANFLIDSETRLKGLIQ